MICRTCNLERSDKWFELRNDTGRRRTQCDVCRANDRGFKSERIRDEEFFILIQKGLKKCGKCIEIKDLEEFNTDRNTRSGKTSYCKLCIVAINSREEKREAAKHRAIKSRYKLSPEEVSLMLSEQEGLCAICKANPSKLVIDHCHETGVVRGLLCNNCNTGLGMLEDKIENLKRAIEYLNKS